MACNCTKMDRRFFIKAGLGSLAVAGLAGSYGALQTFIPAVSYEPRRLLVIGPPEDLLGSALHNFQVADRKVSLLRGEQGFYALVRNCTHMGCIPNLSAAGDRFLCPCHGSVFDLDGNVLKGPAPEPLFRASLTVNNRGLVQIDADLVENDPAIITEQPFLLTV